ncbi:MAG: N-6 DNA methylase [Candidatus Micrarchaeia archaeon]
MEILKEIKKEDIEELYNSIIGEKNLLKGKSEADLRLTLCENIKNLLKKYNKKIPLSLEVEGKIDVLIRDVVLETKKLGVLKKGTKLFKKANKKIREYMKNYSAPYGILTDLEKIYFYELSEDKKVKELKLTSSNDFNYDNFCFLLKLILGEQILKKNKERKKFISEISFIADFGGVKENELILNLLKKLLNLLISSKNKKTKMMFLEWQKLFKLSETTHEEYKKSRREALRSYFEEEINESNEYRCIFCMHTLLSIIIKLLTYNLLFNLKETQSIETKDKELKDFFINLESGKFFRELGVINFCQNDFFSWYINENWDNDFNNSLLSLKNRASLYKYIKEKPSKIKDSLQKLYENFIPREIRHSFGEYFTPINICDLMVSKAKTFLENKTSYRAIDPTCGSGTFLISLLKDKISNFSNNLNDNNLKKLLQEVVGIDLNPISVLMSKFNYLLVIFPYLKNKTNIEIPVYLGDSSYTPIEEEIDGIKCISYHYYFPKDMDVKFPKIVFPKEFVKNKDFLTTLIKIEEFLLKEKSDKEILKFIFNKIGNHNLNCKVKDYITRLIKNIKNYHEKKLNMIWLFIFMNYLKPFALEKFDLIIGNPPWVRWAVLPAEYKNKIKKSLRAERIFSEDRNIGGVDLNICALIAYKVIENLSYKNSILSFIFPKGILVNKSYEGFRRFEFGNKVAKPIYMLLPKKKFFQGEEPIILFLKIENKNSA